MVKRASDEHAVSQRAEASLTVDMMQKPRVLPPPPPGHVAP